MRSQRDGRGERRDRPFHRADPEEALLPDRLGLLPSVTFVGDLLVVAEHRDRDDLAGRGVRQRRLQGRRSR